MSGRSGWRWRPAAWGLARVVGRSMEPTLSAGDLLVVQHGAGPRVGAVVVVRLPDGPDGPRPVAVKRLTRVEPDGGLFVESDALGVGVDSWAVGALPPTALVAVVRWRLPRLRGRSAHA